MPESMDQQIALGQLNAAPQILRLIGEFVIKWSLAETSLLMAYSVAMNSTRQELLTAALASINSTESKIKVIKSTLKVGDDRTGRRADIIKSLSALEKLCEKRNSLMHHLWGYDMLEATPVTIDYRKNIDEPGRLSPIREYELIILCNDVVQVACNICKASGSTFITDEIVETLLLPSAAP